MISKNSVTFESKPFLYNIARVKNSSNWITDYSEDMHISKFKAFKTCAFPSNMSQQEFMNKYRIINNNTYIKYMNSLEEFRNPKEKTILEDEVQV